MKNIFLVTFLIIISLNINSLFENNKPLNIVTYNIHHGRGLDGNVDIERIADVIQQTKADIIALQEVDKFTERSGNLDIVKELSLQTGLEYTAFGKNLDYEGGEYGNAILSRFPIQSVQNFHFENLSDEQRGVLAAEISIQHHSLLFINTHLDHTKETDKERVLYTEKIVDKIIPSYQSDIIILAGDLNDIPGSKTYQTIQSNLKDAWNKAGEGEGFTIPVKNPDRRIDYIFYSGNTKATEANVFYSEASDHLPLCVRFMLIND